MRIRLLKLDKAVASLAALGIPGVVLAVALSISGFVGAVATTTALASLGGPLGMLGGLGLLGVIGLASYEMSKFGSGAFIRAMINKMIEKGESFESIVAKANGYPVSNDLKRALKEHIESIRSDSEHESDSLV